MTIYQLESILKIKMIWKIHQSLKALNIQIMGDLVLPQRVEVYINSTIVDQRLLLMIWLNLVKLKLIIIQTFLLRQILKCMK
jgi:hypothetical protein